HEVKAEVRVIESYSGHGDYKEMIDFLSCQDKKKIKKLFVVHGEYQVQLKYKQTLEENGFSNIEIPELGQEVEI
ncbi:MAG: MBL fold metallo-hydrolase RNA specificity domain-containing protein, partial [Bacteroidota bacterium]|nr:MBL fold metallo-hydrolase RNA specificity domain-containing protein [Bacteroidota bacterium]